MTAENNPAKIKIVIITMGTRHRFRLVRILERKGTVILSASFAARSRLNVLSKGFLVAKAEMKPSSILLFNISGWWDFLVCLLVLVDTVSTTSVSGSWCPGFRRVRLEFFPPPCCFFRLDFESLWLRWKKNTDILRKDYKILKIRHVLIVEAFKKCWNQAITSFCLTC